MNMRRLLLFSIAITLFGSPARAASADGKLRIICFGAHPDDCELQAGGVAAMWAAKGHKVKLVSVTNGDIGHGVRPAAHWPSAAPKKCGRPPRSSV